VVATAYRLRLWSFKCIVSAGISEQPIIEINQKEGFIKGSEMNLPDRLHGHQEIHIHIEGLASADQIQFTCLSVLLRVSCREERMMEEKRVG
jgi:hypothetical protein